GSWYSFFFFFSSRRRHTRFSRDWSSDVCSSDLLWAALFTGGAFILPVFKLYAAAAVSGVLAVVAIIVWVWTGTAIRPEKPAKDRSEERRVGKECRSRWAQ